MMTTLKSVSRILLLSLLLFSGCSVEKKLQSSKFQKEFIERHIEKYTTKAIEFNSYDCKLFKSNPLRKYDWLPDVYRKYHYGALVINDDKEMPEIFINGKNKARTNLGLLYTMKTGDNHLLISPIYKKNPSSSNEYIIFEEFISCYSDTLQTKEFLYMVTLNTYSKRKNKLVLNELESQEFLGGSFSLPRTNGLNP